MRRALSSGACALAISFALPSGPARADLVTFGYSNARDGLIPAAAAISPSASRGLRVAWRASIGSAINAQPLVVDRVRLRGRLATVVLIATEHGALAALDGRTGKILWRRRLGRRKIEPSCDASPDGVFGITATPVVDRRSGRVYAVDVDGRAWALSITSGRIVRGWPRRVHPLGADFVWGALALARNWLYVPIASLCDSGRYHGGIEALNVNKAGRLRSWRTTPGQAVFGGGIWGWGGVSIDSRTGELYVATGNSSGSWGEAVPYAESVVRLSAGLVPRQWNDPLLGPFESFDRDFGTTPVLIEALGCPPQAVAINKDGEMFLYDRRTIAAGPVQRLRVAADSATGIPLYGMPAWDPASRTLVLVSPSTPPGGLLSAGVQAFTLTSACQLAPRWQQAFDWPDAGSAPTIAGGVVYIGTGRNGRVRAYRLIDGAPLWARRLSREAIFAAPALDGRTLYVGDWGGGIWALRAPP